MKEGINCPLNLFTPVQSLIILTLKSRWCHSAGPSNININAANSWQQLLEVAFHNSDAKIKNGVPEKEGGMQKGRKNAQHSSVLWQSLGFIATKKEIESKPV